MYAGIQISDSSCAGPNEISKHDRKERKTMINWNWSILIHWSNHSYSEIQTRFFVHLKKFFFFCWGNCPNWLGKLVGSYSFHPQDSSLPMKMVSLKLLKSNLSSNFYLVKKITSYFISHLPTDDNRNMCIGMETRKTVSLNTKTAKRYIIPKAVPTSYHRELYLSIMLVIRSSTSCCAVKLQVMKF